MAWGCPWEIKPMVIITIDGIYSEKKEKKIYRIGYRCMPAMLYAHGEGE